MPVARPTGAATDHVPLRSAAAGRVEVAADGEWQVRQVSGSAATRDYRCPGCDQVIAAGTPHLVAWPAARPRLGRRPAALAHAVLGRPAPAAGRAAARNR